MLSLTAHSSNSKTAADMANAWAHVFTTHLGSMTAGAAATTAEAVKKQYPVMRKRLGDLETEYGKVVETIGKRKRDLMERHGKEFRSRAEELEKEFAEFKSASNSRIEAYRAKKDLDARKRQLEALQGAYGEVLQRFATLEARIVTIQQDLDAARKQLQRTPAALVRRKALVDEATWRALGTSADKEPWQNLKDKFVIHEEANPVHLELSKKVALLEMEAASLVSGKELRAAKLKELRGRVSDLNSKLQEDLAGLAALKYERTGKIEQMEENIRVQLDFIKARSKAEVEGLDEEKERRLETLAQEIDTTTELVAEVGKKSNQALMMAGQDQDLVRIAAQAMPPEHPTTAPVQRKGMLAAMAGAALAMLIALFRELGNAPGAR
jgi:hypothetical protein